MIENNKETLERLILEEEKSYEEIGRMFNVSGNAIKKRALKFGMELPKRRVINNSENFNKGLVKVNMNTCKTCGREYKLKKLVFIVDHIDGNASNNRRDNLRCICPNCDSQLDTYKSKNKNGARYYYRYKQG